jgi:hypothetical protein
MKTMRITFASIWVLAACTTGGDDTGLEDASARLDAGPASDASSADSGEPVRDTCTPESMGSTIGDVCSDDSECSDGCYCNGLETCPAGTCVVGADPCVDAVDCTEHSCLEETDRCFTMPNHATCSDGDACNGEEACSPSVPGDGCQDAPSPECNDENTCTFDSCDGMMGCVYTPRDLDMDGFISGACGGEDCDDDPRFGRDIFPGAMENCINRRDDNCDGLRDYNDTGCVPTNDTCATAQMLPGAGIYSGATRSLRNDYTLACSSSSGPDAVFRFTLTETTDVRISLAGGGSNAVIALREFAQCATGPEVKCNQGNPPSMLRRSLPAGDYAIIVRTATATIFDLVVRFNLPPTTTPPVDLCNATTLDVSAGGMFDGMFEEVDDNYTLQCHAGSGFRDVALRLTIPAGMPKDVTIAARTSGGAFTPTTFVALATDCSSVASTVQCVNTFDLATLRRRGLAPGTYYILIESSDAAAVMWSANVTITDPIPRAAGDACSTAIDITSAPGSVDLAMMEHDSGNSCRSGVAFRDAFFCFTVPAGGRDVALTTSGTTPGGAAFNVGTALGNVGTCGLSGSELRCTTGTTPITQTWRSLPAGRYCATAATTTAMGTLTAAVTMSPATPIPPNDRCAGAIRLASGALRTDTLNAFEDDIVACVGTMRPDAFYEINVTVPSFVTITVTPQAGFTSAATVSLRRSCSDPTSFGCATGTPASIATDLMPGVYTIVVESATFIAAGDFRIVTTISPI